VDLWGQDIAGPRRRKWRPSVAFAPVYAGTGRTSAASAVRAVAAARAANPDLRL